LTAPGTPPEDRSGAIRGGTAPVIAPSRAVSRRRWRARLATVLFGLLLPLVVLEAAIRLFGPFLPGQYDTGAYLVRDAALGHFHVPGFDGWIKAPEFTTQVTINARGLRDRRESYEKPPGTFRIVLLGDSFVEAVQVEQWEGVAERLEWALNRDATRPVEVVNAGVAAYGTGQEYLLLDRLGEELQPDLVVLLFFVGNDVTNNNYRLELWDGDLDLALKPYFDLRGDGSLALIPGPPPSTQSGLRHALRSCCALYNVLETGVYNKLDQNYPREQLEAVGGLRAPLTGLYDTRPEGEWARAWRTSEALLARVRDRSATLGAPLVVVAAPEWRALDPVAWRDELERSNPRSSRLDSGRLRIEAPTQAVGAIAARLGVSFVDLLPPLQAAVADGVPLYFAFDKHWTATGHAVAARAIHQGLREQEHTAAFETPADEAAEMPGAALD
jgi:hypothetical protein